MSYCIVITHCLFPCTCKNKKLRFCPQTLSSHNKLIWQDKTRTKLWQGWGVHNRSNFLPGLPKDGGGRTPLLHDCHSSKDHSITTKQPCLCNILTEFPLPPLQWLKVVSEVIFPISFSFICKRVFGIVFQWSEMPSEMMWFKYFPGYDEGMHHLPNQGVAIKCESRRVYSVVATCNPPCGQTQIHQLKVSSWGADAADLTDWSPEEEISIHPCFISSPIVLINICSKISKNKLIFYHTRNWLNFASFPCLMQQVVKQ